MDTRVVEPDPDEAIIQTHFMQFKDEALEKDSPWLHIHETQIKTFKALLLMMYNVIKDQSLGHAVNTIRIESKIKPNPFERRDIDRCVWEATLSDVLDNQELLVIQQLGLGSIHMSLFECLKILLSRCPNLTTLWVPYFPLRSVERLLDCPFGESLLEFKMMVYTNDAPTQLDFTSLTNLRKLRIMFQEDTELQLEILAKSLGSLAGQLTELQMKYDKTDFNYLTRPTWFSFFKVVAPLVSLKRLKLKHCFFDDKQCQLVEQLGTVVPFTQLKWLSLQIYEHCHKDLPCDGNYGNTVLMQMAPQLTSLAGLWIKGSNDCTTCQYKSLVTSLQRFSSLDQLIVFTNTASEERFRSLVATLGTLGVRDLALFDEHIALILSRMLRRHFKLTGTRFDPFQHLIVETRRQERNTMFHGYAMASFEEFIKLEFDGMRSFWMRELPLLGLVKLLKQSRELKLFGYNFKCDPIRRVIMLYASNTEGFKDIMYY